MSILERGGTIVTRLDNDEPKTVPPEISPIREPVAITDTTVSFFGIPLPRNPERTSPRVQNTPETRRPTTHDGLRMMKTIATAYALSMPFLVDKNQEAGEEVIKYMAGELGWQVIEIDCATPNIPIKNIGKKIDMQEGVAQTMRSPEEPITLIHLKNSNRLNKNDIGTIKALLEKDTRFVIPQSTDGSEGDVFVNSNNIRLFATTDESARKIPEVFDDFYHFNGEQDSVPNNGKKVTIDSLTIRLGSPVYTDIGYLKKYGEPLANVKIAEILEQYPDGTTYEEILRRYVAFHNMYEETHAPSITAADGEKRIETTLKFLENFRAEGDISNTIIAAMKFAYANQLPPNMRKTIEAQINEIFSDKRRLETQAEHPIKYDHVATTTPMTKWDVLPRILDIIHAIDNPRHTSKEDAPPPLALITLLLAFAILSHLTKK